MITLLSVKTDKVAQTEAEFQLFDQDRHSNPLRWRLLFLLHLHSPACIHNRESRGSQANSISDLLHRRLAQPACPEVPRPS